MDGTEGLKLPMWTLLLLTSSLLTPVNCQFQRAPEDSGCAPDTTCVLITECPRLLEILKQVKSGMGGAVAKREYSQTTVVSRFPTDVHEKHYSTKPHLKDHTTDVRFRYNSNKNLI